MAAAGGFQPKRDASYGNGLVVVVVVVFDDVDCCPIGGGGASFLRTAAMLRLLAEAAAPETGGRRSCEGTWCLGAVAVVAVLAVAAPLDLASMSARRSGSESKRLNAVASAAAAAECCSRWNACNGVGRRDGATMLSWVWARCIGAGGARLGCGGVSAVDGTRCCTVDDDSRRPEMVPPPCRMSPLLVARSRGPVTSGGSTLMGVAVAATRWVRGIDWDHWLEGDAADAEWR